MRVGCWSTRPRRRQREVRYRGALLPGSLRVPPLPGRARHLDVHALRDPHGCAVTGVGPGRIIILGSPGGFDQIVTAAKESAPDLRLAGLTPPDPPASHNSPPLAASRSCLGSDHQSSFKASAGCTRWTTMRISTIRRGTHRPRWRSVRGAYRRVGARLFGPDYQLLSPLLSEFPRQDGHACPAYLSRARRAGNARSCRELCVPATMQSRSLGAGLGR